MPSRPVGLVRPPPFGRIPGVLIVRSPPIRMTGADPTTMLDPPPRWMPGALPVEITPPFGMMHAGPTGSVLPPPIRVVPSSVLVVIAPSRLIRKRSGPTLELGARACGTQQGKG